MRIRYGQPHRALCLILALSIEGCFSQSHGEGSEDVSHVARNQAALEADQSQSRPENAQVAAADPPPLTEEEQRARTEIASETVAELSQERQREYRRAEKAALRAALPIKRAALAQAQATRPPNLSPERDAFDAKITRLRTNINEKSAKLQDLEATPD